MPFGGMLGSTFNFVFENQMEKLQNGDRFYYLQRTAGLHFFSELESNSFAALIMRNTDAKHLPSDVFSTPGLHPRGRTRRGSTTSSTASATSADPIGRHGPQSRWSIRNQRRRPPAPTPTTCATPAASTSCSAAPTGEPTRHPDRRHRRRHLWGDGGNDRDRGRRRQRHHQRRRRRRHHHRPRRRRQHQGRRRQRRHQRRPAAST